jgi:putative two-component system response regulator
MDRCYRKALPDAEALKMVEQESGRHFDPDLARLLIGNADDFIALRKQVNEGMHGVGF